MKSFFSFLQEYDKDLLKWAASNEIDLKSIAENAFRTGVRPAYPDGYIRSQYPDGYFPPISATAALDLQNAKKVKDKAPSDNAP